MQRPGLLLTLWSTLCCIAATIAENATIANDDVYVRSPFPHPNTNPPTEASPPTPSSNTAPTSPAPSPCKSS